jgi:hypothetical protein
MLSTRFCPAIRFKLTALTFLAQFVLCDATRKVFLFFKKKIYRSVKGPIALTVKWGASELISTACCNEPERFVGLAVPELEKLLFVF